MQRCQCNNPSHHNTYASALTQYNGAFKKFILFLLGAVQVAVQGKTTSLLETNRGNLYIFLLATVIYCFAFEAESKIHHTTNSQTPTKYSELFGVVAFISGSLSSISLLTILVSHWLAYIIFIVWAFLSVFVAFGHATLIKETYHYLVTKIKYTWIYKKIFDKISFLWSSQLLAVIKETYNWILQKIKKICDKVKSFWSSDQQILPVVDQRL